MSRLSLIRSPERNQKSLLTLAKLPITSRREWTAAAKLAEGEELGSNLLRIAQTSLSHAVGHPSDRRLGRCCRRFRYPLQFRLP
jgi:hypothetical protein